MPYNLQIGCASNYHRQILRIMELAQFFSEHVYCGIGNSPSVKQN